MQHACLHVQHGPFATVVASADAALAVIDRTHTAYTMSLPAADSAGVVGLHVEKDGLYALLVSSELPLRLSSAGGDSAALYEQDVPDCDGLVQALTFELQAAAEYELRIGPGAVSLQLVLEEINPEADWGRACDEPGPPDLDAGAAGAANQCTTESEQCPADCAALRAACTAANQCCSGRCYARECVRLECRTEGYCERDDECCLYCHVTESPHCH